MIAVAALNLMGVRMHAVPYGRQMGQVILGSAVSLYFTPTVVAALATNIAAVTASAFLIGGLGALILCRVSGVDGKSTFFASIPGDATAMLVPRLKRRLCSAASTSGKNGSCAVSKVQIP